MAYIGKAPGGTGVRQRYLYTATSGQTTFTTSDSGLALSYSDTNYMDVYQNGVLLDPANDYTATSGTSVVLGTGATTGDVIEIIVYDVFSVFNNTVTGNFTVGNNLTVSGTSTLATVDINAGNIDGTTIGAATPAAGTFTTGDFNTSLNVDGTITSDGLTVDGSSVLSVDSSSIATVLELRNDDKTDDNGLRLDFNSLDTDNNDNIFGRIEVEIKNHATEKSNMNFSIRNDSGDLTELFVLDKDEKVIMNGSVGIGTSSPSQSLEVGGTSPAIKMNSSGSNAGVLIITENGTDRSFFGTSNHLVSGGSSANTTIRANGVLQFTSGGGTERMRIDSSGNVGIGESNPASYGPFVVTGTGAVGNFNASSGAALVQLYENGAGRFGIQTLNGSAGANFTVAGSTKMTLDASGNLLVGQSSTIVPGLANTTTGLSLTNNGYIFASKADDNVAWFNRNTSDGSIISLRKNGTAVGSIGTLSGYITIGRDDTAIVFQSAEDNIQPFNQTTNSGRDAAIDLGKDTVRFKDLYLSGSVYLGGTGSANALSDYEEGTFNPFSGIGSAFTGETTKNARYRKIGKLVHVDCRVTWTGTDNSSNNFQLTMPFNSAAVSGSEAGSAAHTGTVFYSGTAVESGNAVSAHMSAGGNSVSFYSTAGGSFSSVRRNEVNGTYDWLFSITYPTDA